MIDNKIKTIPQNKKEKHTCECGSVIRHIKPHERTSKHKDYLSLKNLLVLCNL